MNKLREVSVAVMLVLLLAGCAIGSPNVGSQPVTDHAAAATLVELKRVEVGLTIAADIVWGLRLTDVIDSDEYLQFDELAVKVLAAGETARDAVLLYLNARERGAEAVGYEAKVALVLSLYVELEALKVIYEMRRS